jgi:hypothetical protein
MELSGARVLVTGGIGEAIAADLADRAKSSPTEAGLSEYSGTVAQPGDRLVRV